METLELQQGTDAWLAKRREHNTGSEASVMMGASKAASRNDLLHAKYTGLEKERNEWVENVLFPRGHKVESNARPIAESIVGEDLYAAVGICDDGYLMASFDGITMLEDVVWECKQWNKEKAASVESGICPDEDYWQVVHLLATSGAERCLYMVTDGTEDKTVHCWVEYDQSKVDRLMAGWRQFDKDLAEYQPPEHEKPVEGSAPEHLPALNIQVEGKVLKSNLDAYRDHALSVLRNINESLDTDEDFADAEETVKWCKSVEDKLKAAKDQVLGQAGDIYDVMATVDEISEEARKKRLALDKRVKSEKERRKEEVVANARQALEHHVRDIERTLLGLGGKTVSLTGINADFGGAIKGKKTLKSVREAVDTELANAKIEADRLANQVRANLHIVQEEAEGYTTLFPDVQQLVTAKSQDDLRNLIRARISEHQAAEAKRREAEEDARLAREANAATPDPGSDDRPENTPEPASEPSVAGDDESGTTPTTAPATTGAPPRPSDREIIGAVATAFGVTSQVAEVWLMDMKVGEAA